MSKPTVFISYSHKDEKWKNLLQPHLKLLEKSGSISIWDDRQIDVGGIWFNKIKEAMGRSAVAVCLISADYLASDFCIREEIPYLLQRREKEGMVILPVLIRPCFWKAFSWLKETQMLPRDGKSIVIDFERNCEVIFTEVAESIFNIVNNPGYQPPRPVPLWSPPEKIDINHLPMTGDELFGRQKELEMLDKAWVSESTYIISLVAWGGVGKSTLVNKWLESMKAENYRGAQRVFAWTFHSQGSGEKVTSADIFFSEALSWFGDPDPVKGSPWDKGARLAQLIRKKKTLLVLDGLEPLQSPYEYERGKIKDPGMATLLWELARNNNGLCIITTREEVADLSLFTETTCKRDLEQISVEAGRALLRISGVQGTDAELEAATEEFGKHALALSLLGVYLRDIKGHHISNVSEIPDLDIPDEKGRHPRRMMAAFEKRFSEGAEVELLKILGLFDYPAEGGAIAALRAAPHIPNLTEHIVGLSEADWLLLLQRLREKKLIASQSKYEPDALDCHPLIREHFGEKLRNSSPEAWKEAHSRLYEYYKKSQPKEYPDTIEEMLPLYRAVAHGCGAGRYQEATQELFYGRIRRREEAFSINKLGAFGADLAAISGFFDMPWSQPAAGLREKWKAWVLNAAGFCLRALGRLKEAAQPFQASLDACIAQKDWKEAAIRASNLSELYLTIGDIAKALDHAKQSVEFADQSGDAFWKMASRTAPADALHQAGTMAEAEHLFQEAEEIQKKNQPEYPLLYSLQGFQYCDLLLGKGKYREVLSRAEQTLERGEREGWYSLLSTALDHLSLGRAYLLQTQ
jgi:tetratricopeptide (TPR) repeat protein